MEILSSKDIMNTYGWSRGYTYEILRKKGCPLITGKNGKRYTVEKTRFEKWLKGE